MTNPTNPNVPPTPGMATLQEAALRMVRRVPTATPVMCGTLATTLMVLTPAALAAALATLPRNTLLALATLYATRASTMGCARSALALTVVWGAL